MTKSPKIKIEEIDEPSDSGRSNKRPKIQQDNILKPIQSSVSSTIHLEPQLPQLPQLPISKFASAIGYHEFHHPSNYNTYANGELTPNHEHSDSIPETSPSTPIAAGSSFTTDFSGNIVTDPSIIINKMNQDKEASNNLKSINPSEISLDKGKGNVSYSSSNNDVPIVNSYNSVNSSTTVPSFTSIVNPQPSERNQPSSCSVIPLIILPMPLESSQQLPTSASYQIHFEPATSQPIIELLQTLFGSNVIGRTVGNTPTVVVNSGTTSGTTSSSTIPFPSSTTSTSFGTIPGSNSSPTTPVISPMATSTPIHNTQSDPITTPDITNTPNILNSTFTSDILSPTHSHSSDLFFETTDNRRKLTASETEMEAMKRFKNGEFILRAHAADLRKGSNYILVEWEGDNKLRWVPKSLLYENQNQLKFDLADIPTLRYN